MGIANERQSTCVKASAAVGFTSCLMRFCCQEAAAASKKCLSKNAQQSLPKKENIRGRLPRQDLKNDRGYRDYIGDIWGLCRDNGTENGNYCIIVGYILGLFRDDGKDNGNYYLVKSKKMFRKEFNELR